MIQDIGSKLRVFVTVSIIAVFSQPTLASTPNPFKPTALKVMTSEKLLLTHHVFIPDIAVDQSDARLKIFTDGLVVLTYPFYMKKSGEYRYWLTDNEMKSLSALATNSKPTNLQTNEVTQQSIAQADGTVLIHESSAEKFDIIRHTFKSFSDQSAAQIIIKSTGIASSSTSNDLMVFIDNLVTTTYQANQ
jgi:hypothetical protein